MFNFRRIRMSLLSSIAKVAVPIALTIATGGAAGPAAMQMIAKQIATELAKQLIQVIGEKLNLPQPFIDLAKNALSASQGNAGGVGQSVGQYAQAGGLQLTEMDMAQYARDLQGSISGMAGDAIKQMASEGFESAFGEIFGNDNDAGDIQKQLSESVLKKARDGGGDEEFQAAMKGGSRLLKLAMIMGRLLDSKMDKMIETGEKMDKAKKQGSLSAQMQALGQELSMISNALSSTIKSIGEANTTLARKG
jgi:hypothetical protein